MNDIKYLVLDVDGTLTDGGIYYDDNGNELKKFCTKDGTGIVAARAAGIKIVIITGRECLATKRRMEELKADYIYQNIKDKAIFLDKWFKENKIEKEEVGYIGDDINDLAPMRLCGYIGCPGDACDDVKEIANYVSSVKGGHGAVRDIIESYLKGHQVWEVVVKKVYENTGI